MALTIDDVLSKLLDRLDVLERAVGALQNTADATLKTGETTLRGVVATAKHLGVTKSNGGESSAAPRVASDAELNGQYGDPQVKKDPKGWTGESYKGCNMSQCPPDYLDMLAGFLDWKASKEAEEAESMTGEEQATKRKYAKYSATDAARARGWAVRKRRQEEEGL